VTRIIFGMIIWVSRWYKPRVTLTASEIAETAIHLVRLEYQALHRRKPDAKRARTVKAAD
jgi:hypothetical protein